MKQPTDIVNARRCLFAGGLTLIAGYDAAGKMLVGVRTRPASVYRWMHRPTPTADLKRVRRAYMELSDEN